MMLFHVGEDVAAAPVEDGRDGDGVEAGHPLEDGGFRTVAGLRGSNAAEVGGRGEVGHGTIHHGIFVGGTAGVAVVADARVGLAMDGQPGDGVIVRVVFADVEVMFGTELLHKLERLGKEIARVDEQDGNARQHLSGEVNGAERVSTKGTGHHQAVAKDGGRPTDDLCRMGGGESRVESGDFFRCKWKR